MSRRGFGLYNSREIHRERLSDRQQDILTWVIISSISTLLVQGVVVPTFEQARSLTSCP